MNGLKAGRSRIALFLFYNTGFEMTENNNNIRNWDDFRGAPGNAASSLSKKARVALRSTSVESSDECSRIPPTSRLYQKDPHTGNLFRLSWVHSFVRVDPHLDPASSYIRSTLRIPLEDVCASELIPYPSLSTAPSRGVREHACSHDSIEDIRAAAKSVKACLTDTGPGGDEAWSTAQRYSLKTWLACLELSPGIASIPLQAWKRRLDSCNALSAQTADFLFFHMIPKWIARAGKDKTSSANVNAADALALVRTCVAQGSLGHSDSPQKKILDLNLSALGALGVDAERAAAEALYSGM